jgi:hypothetical protein
MGDHANIGGGRGLNPLFDTAARYVESLLSRIYQEPFFEKDRLPPEERDFLVYLGKIASGNLDLVESAANFGQSHGILDYKTMIEFALEVGVSSIKLKIDSKKALSKYNLDSHA